MAFPCNQFGKQEPGSPKQIKKFAAKFGLQGSQTGSRFHLMGKVAVNGKNTDPVWAFLKKHAGSKKVEWNFATKFVIRCDENSSTCKITRHNDVLATKALKKVAPGLWKQKSEL